MSDFLLDSKESIDTRATGKVLSQFKNSTDLLNIVRDLVSGHVDLELSLNDLHNALDVDQATGLSLDHLGARVGESRKNRTDEIYRIFIKGRIAVNVSDGSTELVYKAARAIIDVENTLKVVHYPPASFHLIVGETAPSLINDMFELIKEARSAGVLMTGVSYPIASSAMLTLGDVIDYPETNIMTSIGYGTIGGAVSGDWGNYRNRDALEQRWKSFTEEITPTNENLFSITWDVLNKQWISVGGTGLTTTTIITSPDAISWSSQNAGIAAHLHGVHHADGLTVAVGYNASGTSPTIITSVDGVNWTSRVTNTATTSGLRSITHSNGKWIGVGESDGVNPLIVMSTNGSTWTIITPAVAKNERLQTITYGDDVFVAAGSSDGNHPYILTSTNGFIWVERTAIGLANARQIYSAAYGNGRFVLAGDAGGDDTHLLTSDDGGITWIERLMDTPAASVRGLAYGYGSFIGVGTSLADPDGTLTIVSKDGIIWRQHSGASSQLAYDITFNGTEFVGCGSQGTDSYIFRTIGI